MMKGGMGLKGIQYYDKYEQNEDYHLGDHGNKEEVSRWNSDMFSWHEIEERI